MKALCFSAIIFFVMANGIFAEDHGDNNANWMEKLSDQCKKKDIRKIAIPGSHDSATYALKNTIAPAQNIPSWLNYTKIAGVGFGIARITNFWAKTQEKSIEQQLKDGVRFLDLRFVWNDSEKKYYTVHGLFGPSLDAILEQIKKFADAHPKEIIILQIGDLRYMSPGITREKKSKRGNPDYEYKMNDKNTEAFEKADNDLLVKIITTLGMDRFVDAKTCRHQCLIENLHKKKKQFILFYDVESVKKVQVNDKNLDLIFDRSTLDTRWVNAQSIEVLGGALESIVSSRLPAEASNFFVLQSQLTSNGNIIKKSLNVFNKKRYKSLKDMAADVRTNLPTWLESWRNKSNGINIVLTDFTDKKTADIVLSLNKDCS